MQEIARKVCIVDAGTCDLTVAVLDLSESVLERNTEELTVLLLSTPVVLQTLVPSPSIPSTVLPSDCPRSVTTGQ
jgi:hypothetical protein